MDHAPARETTTLLPKNDHAPARETTNVHYCVCTIVYALVSTVYQYYCTEGQVSYSSAIVLY